MPGSFCPRDPADPRALGCFASPRGTAAAGRAGAERKDTRPSAGRVRLRVTRPADAWQGAGHRRAPGGGGRGGAAEPCGGVRAPPLLKAPPRGWARPRPALGLSSGDQLATHRHGDSAGTTAGPVTKETFQVQSWGRMPGAGGPPAEARPRGQAAHRAQGDAGVLARVLVSVRLPRA